MFGNGTNVADNGDEIVVVAPAGDDMDMEVAGDTRSRHFADVATDVETIRGKMAAQDGGGLLGHGGKCRRLTAIELGDAGDVSARGQQQVAVAIGEAIEHDDTVLVAIEKKQLAILASRTRRFKEAVLRFRGEALHMLDAPRSPQGFHDRRWRQ